MVRQILFGIILSIVAILCLKEIQWFLHYLLMGHQLVNGFFAKFLRGGLIADIICATIALFLIPFIVAVVPATIYWAVTKREWIFFPHVFWVTWLLLLAVLA